MTDANEESALEKIREHLSAGYSLEEIRSAGWGEWIEYFESKGVELTAATPSSEVEVEPQAEPEPAPSSTSEPTTTKPEPGAATVAAGATMAESVKKVEDALNQDPRLIALVGKGVGVGIIVAGLILALWTAVDVDYANTSDKIRSFLSDSLYYIAFGALVFLAAEILERVTSRR